MNASKQKFSSPDAFRDFEHSVLHELRYVRAAATDNFLATVLATSRTRNIELKAGRSLWRAQLGNGWFAEEQGGIRIDFRGAHWPERMKPVAEKAADGRVNPRGIICLYLSTRLETAVLEMRPLIGSYVSVAQFQVRKNARLIDCSRDQFDPLARISQKPLTSKAVEKAVWSDVNRAFSKPAARGDDSLDYVPTQILAETFKNNGFDGIAYKSSYGEHGFNVALFDVAGADPINCALYRVDDVVVQTSQHDQYFIENGQVIRNVVTDVRPLPKGWTPSGGPPPTVRISADSQTQPKPPGERSVVLAKKRRR